MLSLIIAMVWQAIGYYMVMYMASMAAVPQSLYEIRRAGRRGQGETVLPDNHPPHLDQHPHHPHLLHHLYHQHGLPLRQGHDQRRAQRRHPKWPCPTCTGRRTPDLYGYSMAIGVVIFLFSFILSALVNKVTKRTPLKF